MLEYLEPRDGRARDGEEAQPVYGRGAGAGGGGWRRWLLRSPETTKVTSASTQHEEAVIWWSRDDLRCWWGSGVTA